MPKKKEIEIEQVNASKPDVVGYVVISPTGNQTVLKGDRIEIFAAAFGATREQLEFRGWKIREIN